MSKKKDKLPLQSNSPENYIKTRARNLPIGKCYISNDWQEKGLITILITRNHINGHFTFGFYLVDLYCFGVTETFFVFNELEKYEEYLRVLEEEEGIEECSYVLVHNIIYGAVAYAEKLGFPPANEFLVTQYLLEEDTDEAEMMDIEFGLAGKPAVFTRNIKNADEMIAILTKSVGPGGYTIIDE